EVDFEAAQSVQLLGAHGHHAVLMLQDAIDDEKWLFDDRETIAREQIRTDDDVGDSRFVLEGEENESLRGAGPLPRDHHTGDAYAPPLTRLLKIPRPQDAAHRQLVAPQRHRMTADG